MTISVDMATSLSSSACRLPLGLLGGAWRGQAASMGGTIPPSTPRISPTEPSARYEYTPPDADASTPGTRPNRCPRLGCPPCPPCVTRMLTVLQECADGLGAWPSGRSVSSLLCPALLLLMLWVLAFCFLGDAANVDGPLFRLAAMFVFAKLAGWLVHRMADLPALVGMLVVGVAMKSTGYLDSLSLEYEVFIAGLRKATLTVIMLRAGLGLDPVALRSLSFLVLGLAVIPATVEVAAVIALGYLLLGLPLVWGVLLGLVLCAVAPSVVMPCFVTLRAQRLGVDKGIDTLVVAAASFDDVIAISLFGLVQSFIFNGGTSAQELVQHPLGLVFGILYGAVLGKALQLLPTSDSRHLSLWRFALVLGGGLVVTFGGDALGFHEAGSVGCMATTLTAAAGWRCRDTVLSVDAVEKHFEMVWAVLEPVMFSLIGADINTVVLDGGVVGLAVGVILVSLTFRTLSTWLLLLAGNRFNWKERLFIALAWLPKADVQAALGPLALDAARRAILSERLEAGALDTHMEEDISRASNVLLVAVLAILLTAPAGSVLIAVLSRRLLTPAANVPVSLSGPDGRDLEEGIGVIREVG